MGSLLFSSHGRIGSDTFIKAGYILILIGTAFSMSKVISPAIGGIFGFLSMLLLYPWACIWIKRLHNGGKSGWMVCLYILIYVVIFTIGMVLVLIAFGGDELSGLVSEQMRGEISYEEYTNRLETMAPKFFLPITISGILSSLLTLFIGDKTIPNDDGENQFG